MRTVDGTSRVVGRARRRLSLLVVHGLLLAFVSAGVSLVVSAAPAGAAVTPTTLVQASLDDVCGLAVNSAGDLFICNYYSETVSVLAPTATTIFGVPVPANTITVVLPETADFSPNNIAIGPNNVLYVIESPEGIIQAESSTATNLYGTSVPADTLTTITALESLEDPAALAFDPAGTLYLADNDLNTISVLSSAGGTFFGQSVPSDVLTTVISTGLDQPDGLAIQGGGLFVSNSGNNTVSVITPTATTVFGVTTTADTPTTVMSGLNGPSALAFDPEGDLFVADEGGLSPGTTITVMPASTGILYGTSVTANTATTIFSSSTLDQPDALAFIGGNLFVGNFDGDSIVGVSSGPSTLFGQPAVVNVPTTLFSEIIEFPQGVAVDSSGTIFVSSPDLNTLDAFSKTGGTAFGIPVPADTLTRLPLPGLQSPYQLAFDPNDDLFMLNENGTLSVVTNDAEDIFGHPVAPDTPTTVLSGLVDPDMAIDSAGNIYISQRIAGTISVLSSTGGTFFGKSVSPDTLTTVVSSGLNEPGFLAFANGVLYISNENTGSVLALSNSPATIFGVNVPADTLTAVVSGLEDPLSLAVDSAGDLYVVNDEAFSSPIEVIAPTATTLFGMPVPADTLTVLVNNEDQNADLAYDSAGDLVISEYYNAGLEELVGGPPGPLTGGSGGAGTNAPLPVGVPPNTYSQPTDERVLSNGGVSFSASYGGATATVNVPAGALPQGTSVSLYPATNPEGIALGPGQTYISSFAVSWSYAGDPVPPTASSPITLTITDPSITTASLFYQETTSGLVPVTPSALSAGSVTFSFTSDPAYVVASPSSGSGSGGQGSTPGYDLVGSDGGVFAFGNSPFLGSLPGKGIHVSDIAGIVPTATDQGYFVVAADGGVFSFGNAPFLGSLPGDGVHVSDIVGMVPTANDQGYLLVGKDGGVFSFGNASYEGSLPSQGVHVSNIVGIAATPDARGYWLVSSSGVVYPFGDAKAYGNAASGSIVSIAATSDGGGYWLTSSTGGVDTLGDAGFFGSLPGIGVHASDVVSLIPSADGKGYLLIGKDGGTFAFGDASFPGSLPGMGVHVSSIVGGTDVATPMILCDR